MAALLENARTNPYENYIVSNYVEKLGETQFQPTGFLKMYLIPNSNIMANSPYKIILPTDESHDKSEDEYKVRI
jgi:hypothetical protein